MMIKMMATARWNQITVAAPLPTIPR